MNIIEKIDVVLNEINNPKLRKEIEKYRTALKKKWASKGAYENFGQKEVRKLEDKYIDSSDYSNEMNVARDIIGIFDNWCSSYTGEF